MQVSTSWEQEKWDFERIGRIDVDGFSNIFQKKKNFKYEGR